MIRGMSLDILRRKDCFINGKIFCVVKRKLILTVVLAYLARRVLCFRRLRLKLAMGVAFIFEVHKCFDATRLAS